MKEDQYFQKAKLAVTLYTPIKSGKKDINHSALRTTPQLEDVDSDMPHKKSGKKIWSREEDELLRGLVKTNGAKDWSNIAKSFVARGGKQCR